MGKETAQKINKPRAIRRLVIWYKRNSAVTSIVDTAASSAELAAVSTIEVTAEFLLYQITNLRIALGLLIFCAVSLPIYLPSKGAISTIR